MIEEFQDVPSIFRRKRYLVIFLSFLGFVNLYTLRINLSVAIVAMTNNASDYEDAKTFDWDSKQQGFALSSFFYGEKFYFIHN